MLLNTAGLEEHCARSRSPSLSPPPVDHYGRGAVREHGGGGLKTGEGVQDSVSVSACQLEDSVNWKTGRGTRSHARR